MRSAYVISTDVITAYGDQVTDTVQALAKKETSIAFSDKFGHYCSEIRNHKVLEGKTRLESLMVSSIDKAVQRAELDPSDERVLLIVCTTKGDINLLKPDQSIPDRLMLSNLAQRVANHFSIRTTPLVISNACISGTLGLILAQRYIAQNLADHVIVVGGDELSKFVFAGFESFNAISSKPCRPFDAQRDGINLGEAVGVAILSANKGNIPIELLGGASSNDANHISAPSRSGRGLSIAIQSALKRCSVKAEEVTYVSTHGTGTIYNDEMESKALALCGLDKTPMNCFKGYLGHSLGACGTMESIICMESMLREEIYGTEGYSEKGTEVGLRIIEELTPVKIEHTLKVSSGFGGCNAALLLKRLWN